MYLDKKSIQAFTISFIINCIAVLVYHFFFKDRGLLPIILVGIGSMWGAGLCALYFARKEGIRLSVFARPSFSYFAASLKAIIIVLVTIFASIPFGKFLGLDALRAHLPEAFQSLREPLFSITASLYFLILTAVAGMTVKMLTALGEELMWRGYLWEKLKHLGFVRSSLIIGVLWGLWHAPLIFFLGLNYPSAPWIGLVMMVAMTVAISPVLTLYRLQGECVMVPAVFHGTMNAIAPLSLVLFKDANTLVVGTTGIIGILVMTAFSIKAIRSVKNTNPEAI